MRPKKLALLVLVLLPLTIFWQTRNFDFVWDDEVNIVGNRYLNPVALEGVIRFWQEPYERLYVPLTYTVWAVSAVLAGGRNGLNPSVFHSANLLFHVLSALVVFAILRLLIRHDWAACAGALLFAVHPLQVEPVAWITGMKDVLAGFLSLVAIWQYLLHAMAKAAPPTASRKKSKAEPMRKSASGLIDKARVHYAVATVAFLLSILAKPSAVVTPAIVFLFDYWLLRRSLKEVAGGLGVWLSAAALCVIGTKWVQPESDLDFITPLWARPFIAADALAFYLYKLFIPLGLAPDYGRLPELVIEGKWSHFTWTVPCAVGILLYLTRDRSFWLMVGGVIFAIGILPVSGLLPFSFQNTSTVADRYLYLAMLGPALATAWLVSQARRRLVPIASALIILLLGLASAVQARHWRDDESLFSYALKHNPGSWTAHYGLGRALAKRNKADQAIASFQEAARLKPEFTNAHFSLGGLFTAKGEYDEATAAYRQSLSIAPNFVDARLGLINALMLRGDLPGAVQQFNEALKSNPNRADIYYNFANLQARMGNLSGAAQSLAQALRIKPDFLVAHNSLGRILAAQGDLIRATDHFREAVQIDPMFAEAHESLALALAQQGKTAEAAWHSQEAQRLKGSRYQSMQPKNVFR
jgi:protein O-mannosyl-transferase